MEKKEIIEKIPYDKELSWYLGCFKDVPVEIDNSERFDTLRERDGWTYVWFNGRLVEILANMPEWAKKVEMLDISASTIVGPVDVRNLIAWL